MVQPRTVVDHDPRNNRELEFHDKRGCRKAFVLITNLFVIKTNAFFAAIASVLVMKFKALEQLICVKILFGLKALLLYDYYSIRIVIMDPPVLGPLQGPWDRRVPNNNKP